MIIVIIIWTRNLVISSLFLIRKIRCWKYKKKFVSRSREDVEILETIKTDQKASCILNGLMKQVTRFYYQYEIKFFHIILILCFVFLPSKIFGYPHPLNCYFPVFRIRNVSDPDPAVFFSGFKDANKK